MSQKEHDPWDRVSVLMWLASSDNGAIPHRISKLALYKLFEIAGFTLTGDEMNQLEQDTMLAAAEYKIIADEERAKRMKLIEKK